MRNNGPNQNVLNAFLFGASPESEHSYQQEKPSGVFGSIIGNLVSALTGKPEESEITLQTAPKHSKKTRMAATATALAAVFSLNTSTANADSSDANVAANSSRCIEPVGANPGDSVYMNITNTDSENTWGALRSSDAVPVYNRPASQQYSNVNSAAGIPPNPNGGFVTVGSDGDICYDQGPGKANVIIDQQRVFPAVPGETQPDPVRLLDTRTEAPVKSSEGIKVEYKAGNLILDASNFSLDYCFYEPTPGLQNTYDYGFSFRVDGLGKDPNPFDNEEVVYLMAETRRTNIDETYRTSAGGGPDGIVGFGGSNFYVGDQIPSESQLRELKGVSDILIIDDSNGYKEGEYRVTFDVPCERTG